MRKSKFEEKINKEILLLVNKEKAKYEEINRLKARIKKLENEATKITRDKIAKENELLTLEITRKQLTMKDVLAMIRNEDIISIYKEQEKNKIGGNNFEK